MTSDVLTNSPWADRFGTDLAAMRAEAERVQHATEKIRAVRVVASTAIDTAEARDLLAMLGISPEDVRAAKAQRSAAA